MLQIKNSFITVLFCVGFILSAFSGLAYAQADEAVVFVQESPRIFITEVQTSYESAGQEFIELYNASDFEVDLGNFNGGHWLIQNYSSTKAAAVDFDWDVTVPQSNAIVLSGVIAPRSFYIIAAAGYSPGNVVADLSYTAKLADKGGALRLVWLSVVDEVSSPQVFDRIGWTDEGTTQVPDFVQSHPQKGSLERQSNEVTDYYDEDGAIYQIVPTALPSPGNMQYVEPVIAEAPGEDELESALLDEAGNEVLEGILNDDPVAPAQEDASVLSASTEEPAEDNPLNAEQIETAALTLLPVQITELLPNPAPPATDSADEFIELFNPNNVPVDISGYRLESGGNYSYSYEFVDITIPALSYVVVTSGATPLSLANAGGQARLQDLNGVVIAQTEAYVNAKDGMAWALIDGVWAWTDNATPGFVNSAASPIPVMATAAAAKAKTVAAKKTTAAKKTVTAKTTTAKTAAAKTTKASASGVSTDEDYDQAAAAAPIHSGILAGAGVIAVLYGLYEYRQDIGNKIYQLRRYRAARREART